jgi:hypothetical protein
MYNTPTRRRNIAILLAACYFLIWPLINIGVTGWSPVAPQLYDPMFGLSDASFALWVLTSFGLPLFPWVFGWCPPFFAMHLPLLLAARKLLPSKRSGGAIAFISPIIGLAIGCIQWPIWNWSAGGYDPSCVPGGIFGGDCRIDATLRMPLAASGLLTGLLVGLVLSMQRRALANAAIAEQCQPSIKPMIASPKYSLVGAVVGAAVGAFELHHIARYFDPAYPDFQISWPITQIPIGGFIGLLFGAIAVPRITWAVNYVAGMLGGIAGCLLFVICSYARMASAEPFSNNRFSPIIDCVEIGCPLGFLTGCFALPTARAAIDKMRIRQTSTTPKD